MRQEEAEKKVYELFEKDYLVNPQVTLKVISGTGRFEDIADEIDLAEEEFEPLPEPKIVSYVLLGEVRKPGTYEFDANAGKMTLLKAISVAGGFSNIANMKKIKMLRRDGVETRAFTVNAKDIIEGKRSDEEIHEDDLIVVPESLF